MRIGGKINPENFTQQIERSQQRLARIEQSANTSSSSEELLGEALAEVSATLEELPLATEEWLTIRQQLERERQRYQELFEEAPDGYLVTNQQGFIEEVNWAAAALLNVPKQFLFGKPLSVFIAKSDRRRFHLQEHRLRSLQHGNWEVSGTPPLNGRGLRAPDAGSGDSPSGACADRRFPVNLQPRSRQSFPVLLSVSTIYNPQGNIQGWRWLMRDLREQKQAEATRRELEVQQKLNQFKTNLLHSISHEFRTPLNIISMSAGMIERYLTSKQEGQKQRISERIEVSVKFLLHLLEKIEFVHKDNSHSCGLVAIELESFCRHIIADQTLFAPQHETRLCYVCQHQSVCLDRELLRQILSNLLANALKYSPEEKPVLLTVKNEGNKVIFEIQDWGVGIPQADQPHLFELFYRGSNIDEVSGTGLGLTIVKKAVNMHEGEVTFSSEVGAGRTFTVILFRTVIPLFNLVTDGEQVE